MIMAGKVTSLWREVVVHLEVNSSDDALVGMMDGTMNSSCDSWLLADTDYFSCEPVKDLVHLMDLSQELAVYLQLHQRYHEL